MYVPLLLYTANSFAVLRRTKKKGGFNSRDSSCPTVLQIPHTRCLLGGGGAGDNGEWD